MIIRITSWGHYRDALFSSQLGLKMIEPICLGNARNYTIIDKQLFMLSVIKYGMVFEEINCSM
jgi:hypothetical protein